MTEVQYLIVGAGVAGTHAAETIRSKDPQATIHVISDERYRFYSRIMLSKPSFFLEKVPFDTVYLKSETWAAEHNIGYSLNVLATELDPAQRVLTLNNGEQFHYERLLLAIGCCVIRWPVAGADKPGVHYLRTLDDAKGIIADVKRSKRAIVIGGGFIGFEMCDMLKLAGLDTTLIIREKYFWEPLLDEASGRMIEKALKDGGVNIVYETTVDEVIGDDRVSGVRLKDGSTLPADMIIVGIGTKSAIDWVSKAGITCNRGIVTDEFLETSIPGIYAAGDCAEYGDKILNEHIQFGNWANAQVQGQTAALNMLGQKTPFHHVSFYSAQGLKTAIVFVGDVRVLPGREVIARGTPESGSYGRILLQDGEVEGATLINRTPDLMPLTKIIEYNVKVDALRTQLADPAFDLKTLIPKTP